MFPWEKEVILHFYPPKGASLMARWVWYKLHVIKSPPRMYSVMLTSGESVGVDYSAIFFLWFGNVLKGSLTSLETWFVFRHPHWWNLSQFAFPPTAADGLGSIAIDATQLNMSVTDPTAWATAMNNLGMVPVGLPGQQLVSGKLSLGLEDACSHAEGLAAWHLIFSPRTSVEPGLGFMPRACLAGATCLRVLSSLSPRSSAEQPFSEKLTHNLSPMASQDEFCILKR